ncbi:MAG: phosphatidylglycerophosphatase A family protein [Terriglobales bacterium]
MSSSASAPDTAKPQRTRFAWVIATFFGIGMLKSGPGTWASVATLLLWRALAPFATHPGELPVLTFVAVAAVLALGIPASTRVERESGRTDPSFVVIDEVAGQLIALLGAGLHWKTLLASLILFRVFDIVKPPPLRRLERLREGYGIMLDDVGAGLYALVILLALRHVAWLP